MRNRYPVMHLAHNLLRKMVIRSWKSARDPRSSEFVFHALLFSHEKILRSFLIVDFYTRQSIHRPTKIIKYIYMYIRFFFNLTVINIFAENNIFVSSDNFVISFHNDSRWSKILYNYKIFNALSSNSKKNTSKGNCIRNTRVDLKFVLNEK